MKLNKCWKIQRLIAHTHNKGIINEIKTKNRNKFSLLLLMLIASTCFKALHEVSVLLQKCREQTHNRYKGGKQNKEC